MADKFLKYYSGNDNPSVGNDEYDWMTTAGSVGGNVIGSFFGPIGGKIGSAIGRDAGTDVSRIAEGDNVGKVAFDRVMTAGSTDPIFGMQLPGSELSTGLLAPLLKNIFGW